MRRALANNRKQMRRESPTFSFEEESARTRDLWRASQEAFVPLSVAAAMAFHQAHGTTRAIVTRQDFDDALNIAATALARLIPIHIFDREHSTLDIDLTRQSFARGATELHSDGAAPVQHLCVRRSDVLEAVSVIRRRGVPFSFVGRHVSPRQNDVLAGLPASEYQRIASRLELVALAPGETLYEPYGGVRHVFFPVSGVVSRLHVSSEGESTGIAVVGREGLVGVAVLLGGRTSADRALVQIAGHAYRMSADAMLDEFGRGGELQRRALRYVQVLIMQMAQTAVCNRHHSIEQQLCRWLLLTLDRIDGSEVVVTQELVSQILGVRRAGITEAVRRLQESGLVETRRGRIAVPERRRLEARACECYSAVEKMTSQMLGGDLARSS